MVLSMLLALNACPAMLGTQEAIRQSQSKERREEHRARRCNLIATCVKSSIRSREINGRQLVLRDNKLYIDTGTSPEDLDSPNPTHQTCESGHPFAGYFLPYPDAGHEGLVSTITDVAPILNWIYIDSNTYEVKYGVRVDAQPHVTGPFDCTRQDRRMTCDGWEGFVAVEEYPAVWALYFDRDDDGLRGKLPFGTRVLEIELHRREKKVNPEVLRDQRREQELLRLQMEAQKAQQQQAEQAAEEPYFEDEAVQPPPQQGLEEDADDEDQKTEISEPQSLSAPVLASQGEVGGLPEAGTEPSSDERPDQKEQTEPIKTTFDAADFVKLSITTSGSRISPKEQPEGLVATPTDTNCAASIWSVQDENLKAGRNDSVITYATPDSSILGDDDVTAAEAVFRQNDAVGAPSPLLPSKYRKPYVEDSDE
ncbi:hypothetical protein GTA08_BOTSDO08754 [Botryosphaeria dothidea]|uniref:Uncharacterized protein n=1 Tax=Botryosphaeria dothidea TaxID=55169 RepID=A0A8H4ILH8_9PEZI|nr:hypothetical protein GTA08_BOTSDO08754 [Botryosphaeria dothidea]